MSYRVMSDEWYITQYPNKAWVSNEWEMGPSNMGRRRCSGGDGTK